MSASPQNPPEWDRLLSACQKNDVDLVRRLISEEGVSPSHTNRAGQSALHIAALWGHLKCVEALIDAGANVDAKNNITGATPLHCAIQSSKAPEKRLDVVRLLVERGKANPSIGDSHGSIPYDYCDEDDTDLKQLLLPVIPPIFKALLDHDVDQAQMILQEQPSAVEARHLSKTPLLVAVDLLMEDNESESYLHMLEILLQHGANPDAAATVDRGGHLQLPQGDEVDPPLYQVCCALKDAYRSDSRAAAVLILSRAAQMLVEHGACPTEATLFLVHDAARRGNVRFLDFMVTTLKIDINTPGRQGMTPLHFAARSGQTQMVQFLLQSYPDLNVAITDDQGKSPLDFATANNKVEIVQLLQEKLSAI
ncbi:hypothetical protein MHU86_22060 [Fragilaria crotonensis]|nr:hypothetical protein MHU86_22060 [Fragilaria crotonensis]